MSQGSTLTLFRAEIVYTGMGTPIADGAVAITAEGGRHTYIDSGPFTSLTARYPGADVRDAGFAISPAPVNAHTHLDLTDMPLVNDSYERFIPSVIAYTEGGGRTPEAAKRGAAEVLGSGVRVIGDIVTRREVLQWLLGHPQLAGVAYWEVIGMDPADNARLLAETEELIAACKPLERRGGVRLGLSPHTPHTVNDELLQGLVMLARRYRLPLQLHVEESPLEKPMFMEGTGELAEVRRSFDPDWEAPGVSPLAHLEKLGVLEAGPTLVHMVNVTEDEIRLVHRYGCRVVHCPRSNDLLYCGRFPWETYMKHGVAVGLGTDSRASSPDLSVQGEVRFARELHGRRADDRALVRSAVKGGCQALGLQVPFLLKGQDVSALHFWDGGRPGNGSTRGAGSSL